MFEEITRHAFLLVILISGLLLLLGSTIGLLVSIVQSATQIQEQTIAYFVKFLSLVFGLYFSSDWINAQLQSFFIQSFSLIHLIGKT
ncbi:MAG: flagellar biosynthetic protein FliQ [bacterium]|nr:flagellar biosynthetic protein FliQ [bacterium]